MAGITLYFSPRILRLLTDYRLWAGNQPQAELAQVLAGVRRWQGVDPDCAFFEGATPAQFDALLAFADKLHEDIRAARGNQSDSATAAQWRRRLRESSGRMRGTPVAKTAMPARTVVIRQDLAPLFPQPPAQGPDRRTYEQRVWSALIDFVDFTQTTAYTGADHA